jgi:hypothetical protein
MDRALLNMINQQSLIDPEEALRELRQVEYLVALSDLDPNLQTLRTNSIAVWSRVKSGAPRQHEKTRANGPGLLEPFCQAVFS